MRVGNSRGLGIAEYLSSNLEKTVSGLARSPGPMEVPTEGGHTGLHWCQFTGYVMSSTCLEGKVGSTAAGSRVCWWAEDQDDN